MSNLPYRLPSPVIVDGYKIDLSGGATSNQVLQYNGTNIIPATVSGGSISNLIFPSPTDMANSIHTSSETTFATNNTGSGNQISGSKFVFTADATITGLRFYWNTSTARTISCRIWQASNTTSLAQINVSTTGIGVYTATFSSPVSASKGKAYIASIYETSNTEYTYISSPLIYTTTGMTGGQYFVWVNWAQWGTSDAFPSTIASAERYPVDPIYTVP